MIRKFLHIAFSLYLLILSCGVVLNMHFCGELLQSISVYFESEPCCDGAMPESDCCHDQSATIVLEEEVIFSTHLTLEDTPLQHFNLPAFTFLELFSRDNYDPQQYNLHCYAPPPPKSCSRVEVQSFLL